VKRPRQTPTDRQLRNACPDLWAWYDAHYPKPDRPRRNLLVREFVRRFSHLFLLADTVSLDRRPWLRPEDPSDTTFDMVRSIRALYRPGTEVQKFQRLDGEVEKILTYIDLPPSKRNEKSLIAELSEKGLTPLEILGLLPRLTKRVAGHPVMMRLDAVKAAEMWDAGLSWTGIAQKLHGCKDVADCFPHHERIRKAVKSLDKLFGKMGIPVPARKANS
jgi:hypothetical protein